MFESPYDLNNSTIGGIMAAIGSHFIWGEFTVNIFTDKNNDEYIIFTLPGGEVYTLANQQSVQFKFFIENYFKEDSKS